MSDRFYWARLLAFVTGLVNQELLLRNEYLVAENRILRAVLAKHTKNFSLQNALSIGVDQMQRNFKPMVESVERWQALQLSDVSARMIIYRAFIEAELEVPRRLARKVHDLYFNPTVEEFQTRTLPFARQRISARHGDVTVQASTADADDDTVERPHVSDRQGGLKYKN
jgi:hypothetical protein